jgi:hypothetical protein
MYFLESHKNMWGKMWGKYYWHGTFLTSFRLQVMCLINFFMSKNY